MDLLWMVLMMVLVCSEAQKVVTAELGQDVNLTCSINHHTIYWRMEIHHQFRVQIGNALSSASPYYNSPDYKSKFFISKNRLEIKHVSAEDFRLYFCGKKQDDRVVDVETVRLLPDVSSVTPTIPSTSSVPCLPTPSSLTAEFIREPVLLASFTLNIVLLLVVLGFICAYIWRNGCSRWRDTTENNKDSQEMQNPQYEEIQLPPPLDGSECIYYKAQYPGSRLPQY